MAPKEFIQRLTELARSRGEDAGPYLGPFYFEIYEHDADETHRVAGVYVWPAWKATPMRVDPLAFANVIGRVETLPMRPIGPDDVPGRYTIVWSAIAGVEWAPGMPTKVSEVLS
jgi:hypothetical protein